MPRPAGLDKQMQARILRTVTETTYRPHFRRDLALLVSAMPGLVADDGTGRITSPPERIAAELGLPPGEVEKMLGILVGLGAVIRTETDMAWRPACVARPPA